MNDMGVVKDMVNLLALPCPPYAEMPLHTSTIQDTQREREGSTPTTHRDEMDAARCDGCPT